MLADVATITYLAMVKGKSTLFKEFEIENGPYLAN